MTTECVFVRYSNLIKTHWLKVSLR